MAQPYARKCLSYQALQEAVPWSSPICKPLNDAARAFWPSTAAAPAAPIGRQAAPVGRSAADINAANRAFWAAHS